MTNIDRSFDECNNLNFVIFESGEKEIYVPDDCFKNATNVILGRNLKATKTSAFSKVLKHVEFTDSVTNIADYAFCDCSLLDNVIIPNSVTNIGSNAFKGCSSMNKIAIPNSISKIGSYAFLYCI